MLVDQDLARNRPRRPIKVSSRPSASTSEIRSVSAASSASPQRRSEAFTGCQLHPSSAATSSTGRALPAWRVAQRPARVVSFSRAGAISGSCSVTVPAEQPACGQRHRRLCHTSRAGLPNAGRSTNSTSRSPSDHNTPPQRSQTGLGARRRMCTPSGAPATSSTPSTSTSPSPTNNSQTRVGSHSTGILQVFGCLWRRRFWGIPRVQPRTPTTSTPTSFAKSRVSGWCGCEVVASGWSLAGLAREPPAASVGSARVCDRAFRSGHAQLSSRPAGSRCRSRVGATTCAPSRASGATGASGMPSRFLQPCRTGPSTPCSLRWNSKGFPRAAAGPPSLRGR